MRAADLHRLARSLREAAIATTADAGEQRPGFGEIAIVEDVARHPMTSIGEIAARSGVAQSLVSRLVPRLVAAEVLDTTADASDGRRTLVSLNPRTRAELLLPRGERDVSDALAAVFADLSADELARLVVLLAELVALVGRPD